MQLPVPGSASHFGDGYFEAKRAWPLENPPFVVSFHMGRPNAMGKSGPAGWMTIRTQDAKIPPADVPRMSELLAEKVRLMLGILANAGIDVDSLPLPAYWHERKPILMQFGGGRGRERGCAVSKRQKEDIAEDADDDEDSYYSDDDDDDDNDRDHDHEDDDDDDDNDDDNDENVCIGTDTNHYSIDNQQAVQNYKIGLECRIR